MKMKKGIALLLSVLLVLIAVVGCSASNNTDETNKGQEQGNETNQGSVPATESDDVVAQLVAEASQLSGIDAYNFFNSLEDKGLTDDQIIQFFIDLPISQANQQVYDLYMNDALDIYAETAPQGIMYDDYTWKRGSGTDITGEFTGNDVKMAFTDYVPVEDGPIGDPNKTYKVGVVIIGMIDSWMANLYDSIAWEAARHENLELIWMDYGLDNDGCAQAIDTLIAQDVDAILLWPRSEAPTGPPAQRAIEAGIPVITVDRLCGYEDVTARVHGNFPANGAQAGMYLVWKLGQESGGQEIKGNIVLLRKAAGVTADTLRCGYFLKVISYFPDINILQSYYDNDDREQSLRNVQDALQAYDNIDAFFCEGLTQNPVAYEAIKSADRMNSRENGEKIILLTIDDTKETFAMLHNGDVEMNSPYPPLIGDIGLRVVEKILAGEEVPQDIALPNIPMVTLNGDKIFGLQTQAADEWDQYASGPEYEGGTADKGAES